MKAEVKQTEADVESLTNPRVKGKTLIEIQSLEEENKDLKELIKDLQLDLFAFKSLIKLVQERNI